MLHRVLVQGLLRLEYRGYDSSGIVVRNGSLQTFKEIGKISDLTSRLPKMKGTIGISPYSLGNPWRRVTKKNASIRHISEDGKVAIVHNGILQNSNILRKRLTRKGITLSSETDSEVFCHFIAMELQKGKSPMEALASVLRIVRGHMGPLRSLRGL